MTARVITRDDWTVGELRALGFGGFDASIPDCAEVSGTLDIEARDAGAGLALEFVFRADAAIHWIEIRGTVGP